MKDLPLPGRIEDSVLVTHAECADGAGCAILWCAAGGRLENVRFVPAGGVDRWLKRDPEGDVASARFLAFADVSMASSNLADELEKRGEAVLLDHHKTASHLAERDWCVMDQSVCGSRLMFAWLRHRLPPDDVGEWEQLALLVDDRDRWLNERLPASKQLVDLMNFVGQRDFVCRMSNWPPRWDMACYMGDSSLAFSDEERFVLDVVRRQTSQSIRNALKRLVVVDQPWGPTGYVVSSEWQISELLDEVLRQNPQLTVAAQVNFDKNIVSLRSRDGTDVSEVAQRYNGGGHAGAAGHPLPPKLADMIVEMVHG